MRLNHLNSLLDQRCAPHSEELVKSSQPIGRPPICLPTDPLRSTPGERTLRPGTGGAMSGIQLKDLPREARGVWPQLKVEPPQSAEQLAAIVNKHLDQARTAAATSGFVDLTLGEKIGAGCLDLIQRCAGSDADHWATVQAAVLYFALSEDGDDDLTSMTGFDDDAEVFNVVVESLGYPDLRIDC